ncbi:hypothetical protein A2Z22_03690 [Candidatus Woesebacteria bacterium RBG_16_34_12]|uniref:Uncharacterized protein n=1 Tax=Candidatus Woesebacteria bacterium RBG_16_34_12 TaxID=1802480 RepID=A0A1F7X799_9BACT|nr:MAG: hypothetical protein A2Z22_03690 [Candidatus Woesebacteria bacterium RBG_16_34_12]
MKKIISLSLLLVTFFSIKNLALAQDTIDSSSGVSAPSDMVAPYYPPDGSEPGFLGQDHNYTVVFRGNGEAVVSARIVFTNKTDKALNEIKLRVPGVVPKEFSIYQVFKQGYCMRYEVSKCSEYSEPNYYESYWGESKYQKAKYELDVDTLKITLPTSIAVNKSGAFFIYFRTFGYAKKNLFGAYQYVFESLQAEEDIRNLRIGISTDSDLILRGVKGEIDYRFEEPAVANLESSGADVSAQKSVAIDRYVGQIGQGKIIKTASNLASLESYTVKGAYAGNRLKLYGKEITIIFASLVLVFLVFAFIARTVFKKFKKGEKPSGTKDEKANYPSEKVKLLLINSALSFLSSLLITGYTFAVYFIGRVLLDLVGYQYEALLIIFLVIISIVIYLVLFLALPIYLGFKKKVGWAIVTLLLTVLWLLFYLVVSIIIVFIFNNPVSSRPVYPL